MTPFYEWGSIASRLQSHYEEAIYFVFSWHSFDRPRKDESGESTLELPRGFEHGTLGLNPPKAFNYHNEVT